MSCSFITVEALTLSSYLHIPFSIPIYSYKKSTIASNFILSCTSWLLVICQYSISYSSVSPTPPEDHSNAQTLLFFSNITTDFSYQHCCLFQSWQQGVSALQGTMHISWMFWLQEVDQKAFWQGKRGPLGKESIRKWLKNSSTSSLLSRSRHEVNWNLGLPSGIQEGW